MTETGADQARFAHVVREYCFGGGFLASTVDANRSGNDSVSMPQGIDGQHDQAQASHAPSLRDAYSC
jgi:hypothetical protein